MKRANKPSVLVAAALMEVAADPRLPPETAAEIMRLAQEEKRAARSAPKGRATTKKAG